MTTMTLGDVGPHDDPSYTGETPGGPLTMDYYRNKAREFQVLLNGLDSTRAAILAALDPGWDDETFLLDMQDALDEFDARRSTLKLTAEAINAGAAIINSMGGRFPQLSIPGTLGFGPLVIPAATIAAIGTAAVLAAWGWQWIGGVNERLKAQQLLDAQASPEQRAALAASIAATDNAIRESDSSVWAHAGSALKWIAIGAAAWFAYRAYSARD